MDKTAQTTKLDTTGINCSLTEIKVNVNKYRFMAICSYNHEEAQERIEINKSRASFFLAMESSKL